jgi:hypothetical protein
MAKIMATILPKHAEPNSSQGIHPASARGFDEGQPARMSLPRHREIYSDGNCRTSSLSQQRPQPRSQSPH